MFKKLALIAIILFFVGWFSNNAYSEYSTTYEAPLSVLKSEKMSPSDHIKSDQIKVYNDRIVIEVKDAMWAQFTDTNSMDPIIDIGSNSIEIIPKSERDVKIGDIISYKSNVFDGIIIHRVVDISEDKDGLYYVTKGDNNAVKDPEKVRFSQIHGLVIGVLY